MGRSQRDGFVGIVSIVERVRLISTPILRPKVGVERSAQIAKADLRLTDTNLGDAYASWAEV